MKKFFITAIAVIIAVLSVPVSVAFADNEELADIPMRVYSASGKAYCLYEEKDGEYTLTYVNSKGTKQLYKSKEKFKYDSSISEDGKTAFYSVNNTVYRYSYESGKRKKIYTAKENKNDSYTSVYLNSSPNGEYCFICVGHSYFNADLVIWHDDKTVSQSETKDFEAGNGDRLFNINDNGELFYTLDRDIYVLDFDGKRLVEKVPEISSEEDYEYGYETDVFTKNRTYLIRSQNDIYFGEMGGERHKLSFPDQAQYYISAKNGKSIIAYNGEYVARYDIKSGKSKNILKISPEKYWEKRFDFIAVSGDLDKIVYINYSKKKLVRLSGWNDEKNRYTNRQEIELNGTGQEYISEISADMNTVLIGHADEKRNYYQADFNSGSFAPSEYWYHRTDRFGHKIIRNDEKIKILTPDGSTAVVFDGVGVSCTPRFSNGFYCFYSSGPDVSSNYEGEYDLTYYYIDKNGKAVKWYEETDVYMEAHDIEDWSDWDD